MSKVTYNGIEMKVVQTYEIGRFNEQTDDGATHLWTRWVFDLQCVLNPEAMSAVSLADQGAGRSPMTTDKTIRDYLMQHARTLKVEIGGEVVVESPHPGYQTDAHNGPVPLECTISEIHGVKTFLVRFKIETRINESKEGDAKKRLVVGLRYSRRAVVSEDYLTAIVTEGVVTFRTDELLKQNVKPDEFRANFIPPCPDKFKREVGDITCLSDGASVRFTVTDKEMVYGFTTRIIAMGVTRIEAYATESQHAKNIVRVSAGSLWEAGGTIAAGAATGSVVPGVGTAVGAGVGALIALPRFVSSLGQAVPTFYSHIFVRIWGSPVASTRRTLINLATEIALSRFSNKDSLKLPSAEHTITQDLFGKFIEYQITLQSGSGLLTGLGSAIGNLLTEAEPGDLIPGVTARTGPPVTPHASSGTRGNYLAALVASALQEQHSPPPAFPAPVQVINDKNFR